MRGSGRGIAFLAGVVVREFIALLPDAAGITGGVLVSRGAWMIYHPAGYIVGGGVLLAASFLASRAGR
jgi:hypothetical protein